MLLIHFRGLTAFQEEYLTNVCVQMSSGCFFFLFFFFFFFAARCPNMDPHWATKCHRWEKKNSIGFEPMTSLIPCANSDHWAKEPPHRGPVTISICLIIFIPESTRNHAGSDESLCYPQPKHGTTLSHKMSKGGKSEDEDRIRAPLHANLFLYRAALKAGSDRMAVQDCYIPNTTTYSDINRGYLSPSVAGSFHI